MDEPTAALGVHETRQVGELIRTLKGEGLAIFLISHDLNDVFDLADRLIILSNGRRVGSCRVADVSRDEVMEMIVLGDAYDGRHRDAGDAATAESGA